jgi:hypothetical protein
MMSSFKQLAAKIIKVKSMPSIRAKHLLTIQQAREIGRERNDLSKISIRPNLEDHLSIFDYHLPQQLQRYDVQSTFSISLRIQMSLIAPEAASIQTSQSSSFHLLKEFFHDFLATKSDQLEGSAQADFNECTSSLKCYLTPESMLDSTESYQVVVQLAHMFKLQKHITTPSTSEFSDPAIQSAILDQLRKLNQEPFSVQIARFHVYLRACLCYQTLKADLVRLVVAFGMSFSRNEQMSDTAWNPRWEALEDRYPGNVQCSVTVEDAQNLSRFIQKRAREGLDLDTTADSYATLVDNAFPDDPILRALLDHAAYKGMTVPVIIANVFSSFPTFGWMHLFATNPVLQTEVVYLLRFVTQVKGDVYAGFKFPGVANTVKNLAYLCVRLQSEVGGDEQIKKYNGIGGINNKTPIPMKSLLDKLVDQFKKAQLDEEVPRPSTQVLQKYEQRFSHTKSVMTQLLTQYMKTADEEEDADETDSPEANSLFTERPPSDDDSNHGGPPARQKYDYSHHHDSSQPPRKKPRTQPSYHDRSPSPRPPTPFEGPSFRTTSPVASISSVPSAPMVTRSKKPLRQQILETISEIPSTSGGMQQDTHPTSKDDDVEMAEADGSQLGALSALGVPGPTTPGKTRRTT